MRFCCRSRNAAATPLKRSLLLSSTSKADVLGYDSINGARAHEISIASSVSYPRGGDDGGDAGDDGGVSTALQTDTVPNVPSAVGGGFSLTRVISLTGSSRGLTRTSSLGRTLTRIATPNRGASTSSPVFGARQPVKLGYVSTPALPTVLVRNFSSPLRGKNLEASLKQHGAEATDDDDDCAEEEGTGDGCDKFESMGDAEGGGGERARGKAPTEEAAAEEEEGKGQLTAPQLTCLQGVALFLGRCPNWLLLFTAALLNGSYVAHTHRTHAPAAVRSTGIMAAAWCWC